MLLVEVEGLRRKKAHSRIGSEPVVVYVEGWMPAISVLYFSRTQFSICSRSLARNRVADRLEVLALVERVQRVTHEKSVLAFHDAQATDDHLVVKGYLRKALHVPEAWTFLERPYLDARDCQAVEGRRR